MAATAMSSAAVASLTSQFRPALTLKSDTFSSVQPLLASVQSVSRSAVFSVRASSAATSTHVAAAAAPAAALAATAAAASTFDEDVAESGERRYPPFAAFRIHGTGRRKTAVARVGLIEGPGNFIVNGLPVNEYFQNQALMIQAVKLPLSSLGYETKYDVVVKAHGGGLNAQAQAMVLGIARALVEANAANRPPLKAQGMLTRDPRAVERKKYGLKKARKAPQFSKR